MAKRKSKADSEPLPIVDLSTQTETEQPGENLPDSSEPFYAADSDYVAPPELHEESITQLGRPREDGAPPGSAPSRPDPFPRHARPRGSGSSEDYKHRRPQERSPLF